MGRKKTTGETPKTQFRAKEDDWKNIETIARRLIERDGDTDNTKVIRYALRRAARGGIPLLGEIAAGKGRNVKYESADPLPPDERFGEEATAYLVRGDSMKDDYILDGDFVIVREGSIAQGSIVVAWCKGAGAMLKRFDAAKNELYSGNGRDRWCRPFTADDKIFGVYVGLIRTAKVQGST